MKSMCHDVRRNSPSVTVCSPTSRCSSMTSRMAASSAARSASASMRPASKSARALMSSGGRSRLPTWSARKGGSARRDMGSLLLEQLEADPGDQARGRRPGVRPVRVDLQAVLAVMRLGGVQGLAHGEQAARALGPAEALAGGRLLAVEVVGVDRLALREARERPLRLEGERLQAVRAPGLVGADPEEGEPGPGLADVVVAVGRGVEG